MLAPYDEISMRPPTASSQMTTLLEFLQSDNALYRLPTNSSAGSSSDLIKRRASLQPTGRLPRTPDDIDFLTLPAFVRRSKGQKRHSHGTMASIASTTSVKENPFTDLATAFQESPEAQSAIRQIFLAPRSSPLLLSSVPKPFYAVIKSSERYTKWDSLCKDLKTALFQNEDQLVEFLAGKRTAADTHASRDPAEQGKQRWEQYQRQCRKEKMQREAAVIAI